MSVRILTGDCRDVLATLPDKTAHCCVTSPPYFGLRDYGHAGQIGLEATPDAFVAEMVAVFREVRRVLRDDGTLWLNLGDSYASQPAGNKTPSGISQNTKKRLSTGLEAYNTKAKLWGDAKQKDLLGVPWQVAFALRADGWYLRQDIIWSKRKSARYYYDAAAIAEVAEFAGKTISLGEKSFSKGQAAGANVAASGNGLAGTYAVADTRNKRSVWTVTTSPYAEAHFATFPPDLIEPCIKAGCPEQCCSICGAPSVREVERESISLRPNSDSIRGRSPSSNRAVGSPQRGAMACLTKTVGWQLPCDCEQMPLSGGTVLDPFGGAGTTGLVADRLKRDAILIELNPEYADMAERRISGDAGLFAEVTSRTSFEEGHPA